MSRDSQGLYTLPAGNPVVPGTLIESTWANTTMSDVGQALTDSLPRDGSAPMVGPLTLVSTPPTQARHATTKAYVDQFMAFATGMPLGSVFAYAAGTVPNGYLLCDGAAVSRATYADLFSLIGTTYGNGDNATTFNIPDLRDWFIRGKGDGRTIGSQQMSAFGSHLHPLIDPGHNHTITNPAHSHTLSDPTHNHTLTTSAHSHSDPGHSHNAYQASHSHTFTSNLGALDGSPDGSGDYGHTMITQTTSTVQPVVTVNASVTGLAAATQPVSIAAATTGISLGATSQLTTIASAVTGMTSAAAGDNETRPQNIAMHYFIKAVNDSVSPTAAVLGITSSDTAMIGINEVNLLYPELDIKSNVAFGTVKLDGSGKVPLNQMPFSTSRNLGYFDASSGQTPSDKYPTQTYYSGDTYLISVGGTLLVYDPITLIASSTAVIPGNDLTYVSNSATNPTGWYYLATSVILPASQIGVTPSGNISATNVQDALVELDAEKLNRAGDTITGPMVVATNSTNTAVRITQEGTGNALVVEDSANPDATPLVVNNVGQLIIGVSTAPAAAAITLSSDSSLAQNSNIHQYRYDATASVATTNSMYRARGSASSPSILSNGDIVSYLNFAGYDGTQFINTAQIISAIDGTPGVGDMPGRMMFSTTPDGSATPVERVRLSSTGALGFSGANFGSSGQTLVSQGAAAAPIWGNPQAGRNINANDSLPGLTITQLGTGNALLVEDSASTDSTPVAIDANGKLILGDTISRDIAGFSPGLQLTGVGSASPGTISQTVFRNDTGAPYFLLSKSRGTSAGSHVVTQLNDLLGTIQFSGSDGTNYIPAASIVAAIDGTPGTNNMPGRLVFNVTPEGSATPVEAMRIGSEGGVIIGGNTINAQFTVGKLRGSSTGAYGVASWGAVAPTYTGAVYFTSSCSTQTNSGTPYTLASLSHFGASQGSFHADSTVTVQYGFVADGNLIGATTNFAFRSGNAAAITTGKTHYGFYSANNIATGGGTTWNFYAFGTAPNYFAGVCQFADGTALLPSITNIGDENTGIWFPAADTVAVSTGGTEAMRIGSTGAIGVGGSPSSAQHLGVKGNSTGATGMIGVICSEAIQSGVSNYYNAFSTAPSTATGGTLAALNHYSADQATYAGTVTTQYGFQAQASLIGATTNYGFFSNIASGTGRWNFYANGTADNYFVGNITANAAFNQTPTRSTVASGSTITLTTGTNHLLYDNAATAAALTITLPSTNLTNGQAITIATRSAITSLTVNGGTIYGNPTTLAAGGFASFIYSSGGAAWFRKG